MKIFILFFTLGLFSGCECETYIYVHRDLVGDAWMSENKNCIVDYDEAVVTIDMEKTSETQRKLTPAQWLKENTAVIDYNKSYNNIACIHTINDPEKYIAENQEFASMTLEELKEKLMMQAFDYDDPKNNYKKFVRLYFNGSAIEFELCDDFLPDQNYYSIALFKSMIAVGKPNGMPVFEFCHAKTPNEEVILIRLKGEKAYAYYDFSHHPFHGKYLSSPM